MAKRLFDIVIAATCLVVFAPVMLVVAALVRLESRGPVIFRGKRIGRDGVSFEIFKFRTMRESAEAYSGPRITAQDDPRVTRLGRFLRDTKLNEIPQLLNVLRGEMSLVGPRPEDPSFVAHYTDEQREVLSVTPGVTGMSVMVHVDEERLLRSADAADVYLESIMPSKLEIERVYVRNQSLLLDLEILWRTAMILVPGLRRRATIDGLLDGPVRRTLRVLTWYAVDAALAFASLRLVVELYGISLEGMVGSIVLAALPLGAVSLLVSHFIEQQAGRARRAAVSASAAGALAVLLPLGGAPLSARIAGVILAVVLSRGVRLAIALSRRRASVGTAVRSSEVAASTAAEPRAATVAGTESMGTGRLGSTTRARATATVNSES